MITVYFIRHGQSEANLKGIIQGHAEFPLSSLGEKQIKLAGKALSNVNIDHFITSDLGRAVKTCEAIAKHHSKKVESSQMVREIGLGPLQGKTRDQMYEEFPNLQPNMLLTSGIKGTETLDEISNRCEKVVEKLLDNHAGKTVAIVSHGGFISIMLMFLIAGRKWHELEIPFIIGNTGITKITMEPTGHAKIHFTNRTDHLEYEEGVTPETPVAY
ncbi:histidine phosphatase family protein [Salipaludibacillus neizhouensis]|uniref:Histidine phosphatase family protein n=1 Tax=Salipaludibacillus neizhouensis TaxID=885475 RepID=A0A3A9K738_9BACI|nr:histidine phosphatase family protein [Salipaludibacillus neizhouensis]RKL66151.1 histidine phosphatase family protein [Salipaludibacillus neizhouensis]